MTFARSLVTSRRLFLISMEPMDGALAIITARGGSKRIPRKNLRLLGGIPLIEYTIKAALNATFISEVIVSSDDDEIIKISKRLGADVLIRRPDHLSGDAVPSVNVLLHEAKLYKQHRGTLPEEIVLLQPTSPFRTSVHIDEALKVFREQGADTLVSVRKVPHNFSPDSAMILNEANILIPMKPVDDQKLISQKKAQYFARNGAIYITSSKGLLERHTLFGPIISPYVMDMHSSVDIDEPEDFRFCEYLIKERFHSTCLDDL